MRLKASGLGVCFAAVLVGLASPVAAQDVPVPTEAQFHAAMNWIDASASAHRCGDSLSCLDLAMAALDAGMALKTVGDANWNKFWPLFIQLQIIFASYDCPSIVRLTPYAAGRGVNFNVECTYYAFDVKDYGGRWLVNPRP